MIWNEKLSIFFHLEWQKKENNVRIGWNCTSYGLNFFLEAYIGH